MFCGDSDTHPSLLNRLSTARRHEDVWPTFVEKYGQMLYAWCLRWGASPADAEDIVQQTLLSVFRHIELFRHNGKGSFRAWLRRIAKNVWLKIVRKSVRLCVPGQSQLVRLADLRNLRSGAAREDLLNRFDALACEEIRDRAHELVKQRVSPATWDAYVLCDHEKLKGSEIANQLGTSVKAVHLSAIRVRRMIREELTQIEPTLFEARVRSHSHGE